MVAITVVLAAVVFVLVSNIGGDSENTPTISFAKNEGANTLTVVSAQTATWENIVAGGTCTTNEATLTSTVEAGDAITVSSTTACTLTLTYTPSNALLGSWDFN